MSYQNEFDKKARVHRLHDEAEEFDREFAKMGRRILAWWIIVSVLSAAVVVTLIWAIVQIVQWLVA
jgi:hypothetical protein